MWAILQSCYGVFGGQQISTYYPSNGASGQVGLVHNIYPFSAQYSYNSHSHGFGVQYPQMMQFPILPRHYGSAGILALPSSMAMPITSAGKSQVILLILSLWLSNLNKSSTLKGKITLTVTTTATTTTTTEALRTSVGASQTAGTTSEQNSSAESLHR